MREKLQGGRRLAQEFVEGAKREVGVAGAAQRVEQRGRELGQDFAGARAAHGGIAPIMPALDDGDGGAARS